MFLIKQTGLGKFESCGARTSNSTKRGINLKVKLKRQKLNQMNIYSLMQEATSVSGDTKQKIIFKRPRKLN